MIKNSRRFSLAIALAGVLGTTSLYAQESAYTDLNACTKDQQIKLTAKGAITGALAGFGGAFLSGKSDDAAKAAAIGAAAGGIAGFATAYYTAIDTCMKLNPTWLPESHLVRDPSKSIAQVYKENRYKSKDGIQVQVKQMTMPATAQPGGDLTVDNAFDVMTPDNAETKVVIERKLFAVVDGKETTLPFPGRPPEERTLAAGRSVDTVHIPIAADAKPGTVYRVEFSVAAGGKAPAVTSKSVTIANQV